MLEVTARSQQLHTMADNQELNLIVCVTWPADTSLLHISAALQGSCLAYNSTARDHAS